MKRLAALLLACVLPAVAAAQKLRVDVLIFLNPLSSEERGSAPRHPDDDRATSIDDLRGLAYVGIALLPEEASTLAAEWALLKASKTYQPLMRLSWLQDPPRADGGPALRIYLPGGDGISALGGWLRLRGGHHLALSADLEYLQATAAGQALGLRLQEKRTLEPSVLHYLDSPRLGVLARVSPAR